MILSAGSIIVHASSGSSDSISSVEPLMSANNAVTVLRSPSIVVEVSCSGVTLITGAIGPSDEPIAADVALPDSAVPQSSQNADEGAFSAPHFAHLRDSGLPHAAQNFLPD